MALTTGDQVRTRIQDQYKYFDNTYLGDGTATRFVVPYTNVQSATAFVAAGGTAWSATGCTINASGYVDFSGIISANTAWRIAGHWSVFSDDEIGWFTAVGGNVPGAALQAVRALWFDGLKRKRWMSPDGTQVDDAAAINLLRQIESALRVEVSEDAIAGGSLASWGEKQEDYT